jgi:hypothetical protein
MTVININLYTQRKQRLANYKKKRRRRNKKKKRGKKERKIGGIQEKSYLLGLLKASLKRKLMN